MMPFRMSRRAVLAAPLLAMPLGGGRAIAAEGDFNGFLAGLRRDALAQGIRSGTVDLAFRYIQFLPRVIELDQHQPDHKLTFAEFMTKVVTQQRLDDARRHLAENLPLLQRVQQLRPPQQLLQPPPQEKVHLQEKPQLQLKLLQKENNFNKLILIVKILYVGIGFFLYFAFIFTTKSLPIRYYNEQKMANHHSIPVY